MSEKAVSACFKLLIIYLGTNCVECMRINNDILSTFLTLLDESRMVTTCAAAHLRLHV
jgi:hypothetical protein